jgi:YfiR/HmsC-like
VGIHALSSRLPARRAFLGASVALGIDLLVREGRTQTVEVPVRLQAELLSKVVAYDRNYAERARGRATVLVLVMGGDSDSERVGEQIQAELAVLKDLGGLPHVEETVRYSARRSVAELCASRNASVLYVSVGLLDQMSAIASALENLSILSVAVAASYVERRAVLGFDAEAGRPKLVVHLDQARRQKVAFKPEVLKLARVVT